MNRSIFILIIGICLVQAFPSDIVPEKRSTLAAQTRYTNTVNALNTKTATGAAAVSSALTNTTLNNITSIRSGLDYLNWNINTAKTQSTTITTAIVFGFSGPSCDDIRNSYMLSSGVLNTSISFLAKINPSAATYFQTIVNSIVQDIYKVYFDMKAKQNPLLYLYVTTTDTTYDLMCSVYNNIAQTMNDIALNYTQTLLSPAVVACAEYSSTPTTSNLSKIITSNDPKMYSSMIAAQSAFIPYMAEISGVLPFLQNGISDPFSGIQGQSLIIEYKCMLTTTTTTTTVSIFI